MGNQQSGLPPSSSSTKEEPFGSIPAASLSSEEQSQDSSSSSSSSSMEEEEKYHDASSSCDPYEQQPHPTKEEDQECYASFRSRKFTTSSSSSECYRLFRKQSSPLFMEIGEDPVMEKEPSVSVTTSTSTSTSATSRTTSTASSCSPRNSLTQQQHSSFQTNSPQSSTPRTNPSPILSRNPYSFSNCLSSEELDTTATAAAASLAGCVATKTACDWEYTPEERDMVDGALPTEESDLTRARDFWIVTTAALPWMTGTAVNPLLRAAYLSQRNRRLGSGSSVTLVLPWLESPQDRIALYGSEWETAKYQDQEAYIRNWLATSAELPQESQDLQIEWYPARYHAALSSIFAMGDLCELVPPSSQNMICILEEPEHVNFYRAPGRKSWRDKFPHVIGILHTNYKAYATKHYSGLVTGPLVGALSSLMVRAYCDKVVKLSSVLQTYAPEKEVVSNVHGIRQDFLHAPLSSNASEIYFIGKLLWAKGLDKLLELEAYFKKSTGQYFSIDILGSGPEQTEIARAYLGQEYSTHHPGTTKKTFWRRFRQPIPAQFLGRKDHAQIGGEYKIFVNPSITEVLCTTSAEAIAMGKWVIVPKHASNEFFLEFANCLQYSSKTEFVQLLQYAMAHDPPRHFYPSLTWQAATDRLIQTSFISRRDKRRCQRLSTQNDKSIQDWHYALGTGRAGDVLRKVLGGGPVADQSKYSSCNSLASLEQQEQRNNGEEDTTTTTSTTPSVVAVVV